MAAIATNRDMGRPRSVGRNHRHAAALASGALAALGLLSACGSDAPLSPGVYAVSLMSLATNCGAMLRADSGYWGVYEESSQQWSLLTSRIFTIGDATSDAVVFSYADQLDDSCGAVSAAVVFHAGQDDQGNLVGEQSAHYINCEQRSCMSTWDVLGVPAK